MVQNALYVLLQEEHVGNNSRPDKWHSGGRDAEETLWERSLFEKTPEGRRQTRMGELWAGTKYPLEANEVSEILYLSDE